jgi:hypothetical protein
VPDTTASNIACMAGDGVWWTMSSRGITPILEACGACGDKQLPRG